MEGSCLRAFLPLAPARAYRFPATAAKAKIVIAKLHFIVKSWLNGYNFLSKLLPIGIRLNLYRN